MNYMYIFFTFLYITLKVLKTSFHLGNISGRLWTHRLLSIAT